MIQLFSNEFVRQLWRLNPVTKMEEIDFSFSSKATSNEKMDAGKATCLFSVRFWTGVQKQPRILLPCALLAHQTLLW